MARNVTYSVSPRINPREKDEAPLYFAHVQANGEASIREMAERIQQTCTVHKSDVFAVLVALEDVITDALKGGEISAWATSAASKSASQARVHLLRKITMNRSSRKHASTSDRVRSCPIFSETFRTKRWLSSHRKPTRKKRKWKNNLRWDDKKRAIH